MRSIWGTVHPFLSLAACLSLLFCAPAKPPVVRAPPTANQGRAPRVGLALGGGGARGFAEIGVLRVLEQEKIPIDVVVGTSVGSLVGALYADSKSVLDAEFLAVGITEEDLFDYKVLSLFSGGLVKGEKLENLLNTVLKHKTIESLPVPFAAVAVDLKTGQAVAFEHGSIAKAVHASAAIPGVFVPVAWGGTTFVDGGAVDPIPVDVARRKGADVVIAVAIPRPAPKEAPENPVEVAYYSMLLMSGEIARCRAKEADVVLWPDVGDVSFNDFSQKKRLIEAGEAVARRAMPEIRAAIEEKARRMGSDRTVRGSGDQVVR